MKRLYRSRRNKKLAGVCAGLGDYFEIDPSIIRLLVLIIGVFTAVVPIIIAYFIAAIIIPLEPMNRAAKKYKRLYRSTKNKVIAGVLAGVAKYFKIDPIIIRLVFIFLMLITALVPMIVLYFIAAIIIPENPGSYIDLDVEKH